MVKIRRPTVAGTFYEGSAESLKKQIESCFLHPFGPGSIPVLNSEGPREVLGVISPHAGYMYSGPVAANTFFELASDGPPETVVILGPNHTGCGSSYSIMNEGVWQTPLGDIKIDTFLANKLLDKSSLLVLDDFGHKYEHSIEVQLPFLQYIFGNNFKLVPISFLMQDLKSATEIGKLLAEILADKNVIVIASSDLTHYEPPKVVKDKDLTALRAIENLDEENFYELIKIKNISACGYAPISSLMTYSKYLGAKKAKLLCHKTSSDITGDILQAVGYGAVIVKIQ